MKKITIIFIVVCCLLNFIEISFLAEEHVNFADYWNVFTDYGKQAYLVGVSDGLAKGFLDCVNQFFYGIAPNLPEGEEGEKIRTSIPIVINEYFQYINFISGPGSSNRDAIIKVITDLYKDPANVFIPIAEMSFIAYCKLKGEDIEPLLQKARELDIL
jgi:hypothetical protein